MRERIIKEDEIHFCVYKLLDSKNNVLYVGKSKQLKTRIFNHTRGKSNIEKECSKKICRVEFLEFENECDMDLFEIYSIYYYNPPYNKENTSKIGIIEIEMPKQWNELNINTFEKNIKTPMIRGTYDMLSANTISGVKFNKNIFTNVELSTFLDAYTNKNLNDDDIRQLLKISNIQFFDIDKVNEYIHYNNPKLSIEKNKNGFKLVKNKNGCMGFGSLGEKMINGNEYITYRLTYNGTRHMFYGKTREEIAEKVWEYLMKKRPIIITQKGQNNNINQLIYTEEDLEETQISAMLTKDDIMDNLHIKDVRTYTKLIDEEGLPYIKIGKQLLTPVKCYNNWINSRLQNKLMV